MSKKHWEFPRTETIDFAGGCKLSSLISCFCHCVIFMAVYTSGPPELVQPLRPWSDQKSCYLWSKACIFRVTVGPIIVRLRFFPNGPSDRYYTPLTPSALFIYLLMLELLTLSRLSYKDNGI